MNQIDQLADLLARAERGVAFSGAGMSTESGVADFRSPGGVWDRYKPVYYDDFIQSREARVRYWKMRRELFEEFKGAAPNAGHRAVARLEALGRFHGVITQNIDGLHTDAGSHNIIEIHGTAREMACIRCGKTYTPPECFARIDAGEETIDCDACGSPVKERTISFGQAMPQREMRDAAEWCLEADLCLVLGSSLVVEPAASLPRLTLRNGGRLAIINRTDTPLDAHADLVIHASIGETLAAALRSIDPDFA